jgi:hypothetical protein
MVKNPYQGMNQVIADYQNIGQQVEAKTPKSKAAFPEFAFFLKN